MERIETIVVVGAGQAGLATSYLLRHAGHEHPVLEREPPWPRSGATNAGLLRHSHPELVPEVAGNAPTPDPILDGFLPAARLPISYRTTPRALRCP